MGELILLANALGVTVDELVGRGQVEPVDPVEQRLAALESAVERQSEGMQQAMQAVAEALRTMSARAGPDELLAQEFRKFRTEMTAGFARLEDELRAVAAQDEDEDEGCCSRDEEDAR